jgi:MFS family permease
MLFLLIFTGYWIVFWQQFTLLPGYIHNFIDPNARVERVLSIDAAVVICFTLAWNHLIRKIPPFRAVILGTLVSALSWLVLALWSSYWGAVVSIFILALGEITQAPKYYEYISKLAPAEQQGTYMGFAFLPIGLGSLAGGWFGGAMLHHFGELQHHPERAWYAITGVGVLTTLLLWIYNRVVKPEAQNR